MDIEPLNTFDILAMLDVPVLLADHVSATLVTHNQFDSFGRPP